MLRSSAVWAASNSESLSVLGGPGKLGFVVLDVALDVQLVDDVADRAFAIGGIVHGPGKVGDDVDELGLHRQDEQGDHSRQAPASVPTTTVPVATVRRPPRRRSNRLTSGASTIAMKPAMATHVHDADRSEQQPARRGMSRGQCRRCATIVRHGTSAHLFSLPAAASLTVATDRNAASGDVETVVIRRPRHVVHEIKPSLKAAGFKRAWQARGDVHLTKLPTTLMATPTMTVPKMYDNSA